MSSARGRSSQLKILWHLLVARIRGETHQERLESFYKGQADGYDSFRQKLLHGRQKMIDALDVPENSVWVDLGAGTGENTERFGDRLAKFRKIYIVDLCQPLLDIAEQRIAAHGWQNVQAVNADATRFLPEEGQVDLVTFSYSLTMIPDWFAAMEHAYHLLKPGGHIGVVDFYVSRKYPEAGLKKHGWFTRTFWPTWFGMDNVFLSPDHIPFLHSKFEEQQLIENRGKVPWIPFIRVPHYIFVGKKPDETAIYK